MHLLLQITRNSMVIAINHDLHDLAVRRCGVHSLPFLWAFVSFASGSVWYSPRVAASTAKVIKESENSKCDTEGQNGASDTESTSVPWFVVFTEDLRAVDASYIGAHDDSAGALRHMTNLHIEGQITTYNAIASARSSESSQVSDIHEMLSGCEKVPKTWVQTTPK
jgi:hypothetical protein